MISSTCIARVLCGTEHRPPSAKLRLNFDGDEKYSETTGDGPVDAIFTGIKELTSQSPKLQSIKFMLSPKVQMHRRRLRLDWRKMVRPLTERVPTLILWLHLRKPIKCT